MLKKAWKIVLAVVLALLVVVLGYVDPARFKAFEAGGFVDEFDEFARLFRAGHGRGDGGAVFAEPVRVPRGRSGADAF